MSDFREEYEKKYSPMRAARKDISPELHETLVALCQRNCWVKRHGIPFHDDPCLEADSPYTFCEYDDIAMLKLFFEHGNWSIRQGVVYKDLFFCNQVNGGDEWWTCRYDHEAGAYFPFESVTMKAVIDKGEFETLLLSGGRPRWSNANIWNMGEGAKSMNDLFSNWLDSGDAGPCCFQEGGHGYIVVRIEKNADFEYLFCQQLYHKENLTRSGTFKYAGIYCRKDGLLYDIQYSFSEIAEGPEAIKERSAETLREKLKAAVRGKVEAAIGNNRSNLQVAELTDSGLLSRLEYTLNYDAKETARRRYLDTVDFEPQAFSCHYDPDYWKEDSLLSYIADPEGYAQKQAEAFIAENQENMLFDFLYNDAVLKEYRAILADTENPVHLIKKISAAMAATSAKTVNVTISKNGTEFTFKTEAFSLRGDCGSHYNSWSIVAADRRKFEELFGRSADYTPEEILCITYARNVLYEAGK